MANGPIGISFLPSQENAEQGMQRGAMEGDLGEAFKILSLRMPRVLGARAPTARENLTSPGAGGLSAVAGQMAGASRDGQGGGFNPNAALFEALIAAMMGGGSMGKQGSVDVGSPNFNFLGEGGPAPGTFNPGGEEEGTYPFPPGPARTPGNGVPLAQGSPYTRNAPSKFEPEQRFSYSTGDLTGY